MNKYCTEIKVVGGDLLSFKSPKSKKCYLCGNKLHKPYTKLCSCSSKNSSKAVLDWCEICIDCSYKVGQFCRSLMPDKEIEKILSINKLTIEQMDIMNKDKLKTI